jgi:hypothetical protein
VDRLSTVDTTLVVLGWLDELGLGDSPLAEKAIGFLLDVQDEDGAWDEDRAVQKYPLPAWFKPGRPQTILYLTASAAFRLASMRLESEPAFRKGASYLAKYQEGTGKFLGVLSTTWLATSVFYMDDSDSDVTRRGLQFLRQRPLPEWEGAQLAGLLNALAQAGLPGSDPWVASCLEDLARRQMPEGGWARETGAADAGTTLLALQALRRYGSVAG